MIKFIQFLRFLYAPPTGSTVDTQLTQAHNILSSAKIAGGRFAKGRKLASEVVSAGRAPLLGDLSVFMAALLDKLTSTLDESLQRCEELGEVRGPPFNSGQADFISPFFTRASCIVMAVLRMALWCEVPLQRPSVLDQCYCLDAKKGFQWAGRHPARAEVDEVHALVQALAAGDHHLKSEYLRLDKQWGIRVLQKKCVLSEQRLVTRPFFPVSDQLARLIAASRRLGQHVITYQNPKTLAQRTQPNVTATPLLQTARGIVGGPAILQRCNELTNEAAGAASGSAELFSQLRRGGRQSLLLHAQSQSPAAANLASSTLALAMDHHPKTAEQDYSLASSTSTRMQETAYTKMQAWFVRVAKLEQTLPTFMRSAADKVEKLAKLAREAERKHRAAEGIYFDKDDNGGQAASSSESEESEDDEAPPPLTARITGRWARQRSATAKQPRRDESPPPLPPAKRPRGGGLLDQLATAATLSNKPPTTSIDSLKLLEEAKQALNAHNKEPNPLLPRFAPRSKRFEPSETSCFALRRRSRKANPLPAEVVGLVGLVRARKVPGVVFRLRVRWKDRTTTSIIGLEDIVWSTHKLPPIVVKWVAEKIEEAGADTLEAGWWAETLEEMGAEPNQKQHSQPSILSHLA
jgi:hypothetical protein